jgi:4-hydroxybenzoyl-CoA reductase subunit beta
VVVHIGRIDALRFVREDAEGLHLGPLVTLAELSRHPIVARDFPALARAAGLVAGPQLRNMGTLGGNLCLDTRCTYYNQTYFWREALGFCLKKDGLICHVVPQGKRCVATHASDTAPVLIALGAQVEIASASGMRALPVNDFFVGDGVHNNVLLPGEIVTRVLVPATARGLLQSYHKLRPRGAIDFPMLSVAFAARIEDSVCMSSTLVVSALAAKPRVIGGLDGLTRGRALDDATIEAVALAAHKQCRPLTNIPYDEDYRHAMVPVFVRRALRDVRPMSVQRPSDAATWAVRSVDALGRWRAEARRFVLATVTGARGFTPRKPGAHMLVCAGGETCGTVGGGAIEQRVIAEAHELLRGGGVSLVRKHLTQELGMCCGGEMEVFLEAIEPAPKLYVLGAGDIARPLAALASGCGFDVTSSIAPSGPRSKLPGRVSWARRPTTSRARSRPKRRTTRSSLPTITRSISASSRRCSTSRSSSWA